MNWQTEYVAFDGDTGFTLRVYQPTRDVNGPWTWAAYDPDMDEVDNDYVSNYDPETYDTEPEARAAAETWYASYLASPDGAEDDDYDR
jgi:hypothetical protein